MPLKRLLAIIRPAAAGRPGVPARSLLGWYLRKGLVPAIRGTANAWRFKRTGFPIFIGRATHLSYTGHMHLGKFCSLGAHVTVLALSRTGVHLGDRVTLREYSWVQCASNPGDPGEGLRIGNDTYIGPFATIGVGGKVEIGERCQIGAHFTVIAENHAVNDLGEPSATQVTRLGVEIGEGCWIGHGVTILDGVSIGADSIVGAGAVVTRSFPPGSKIAGVPARALG